MFIIQGVLFVASPSMCRRKLYLMGYSVTAAVLGDTIKGTHCIVHGNTIG